MGDGESQLLHRIGPGLAHVHAGDRQGVPLGRMVEAVLDQIGGQPQRWPHREDIRAARHVFLEDVILRRALQCGQRNAALLRHGKVERQHHRRGGIDGHGHADRLDRNTVEQHLHVIDRINRDADLADRAKRLRRIRVVADLRGQIESNCERLLVQAKQVLEALVSLVRGAEAGIGPDRPKPAAVHGRIDPTRIGSLAGEAQV